MFEIFSQVQTALHRPEGGLGIGLALVKGIAELRGGNVEVSSEGLGRGSRFTIVLPQAPVANASSHAAPRATSAAGARRVLVADDDLDGARMLGMVLDLDGHEVRVLRDGRAAIEAAHEFRLHTVLIDVGMPRLNGHEVARALRRAAWAAETTLVALAGMGREIDRRLAL